MNHTPASSDPFEMDDAAYLLGALSPLERSQYEQHLQGCAACARSVAELAGLPGMLRRLPVEVVESLDAPDGALVDLEAPAPPSLLAGALHRVELEERRERRLRTARWFTTVAVGAAAVTVGFIAVLDDDDPVPPAAQTPPTAAQTPQPTEELEFVRAVETALSANASLREVAWGTKIQLECAYPPDSGDGSAGDAEYSLVVRDTDGQEQQVATWNAVAGKELTIDAATAVRGDDIASLEVLAEDGTILLRTAR
ncbi:anti-sigma factor family protein [Cellulomonas aerilata]|uniref:Anti-sigma factor n=1 Tax=Cellulomonas aerilata TaxID=515326 RepID=A0A512D7G9_9CELL|nr:zf-HC2 domain-containing protein [Cellulomonas aerilata]GEO32337.1 anti-sigma factor [Cellulomonas aerilata]